MIALPSISDLRSSLFLSVWAMGLFLLTTSCDFGAAKNALDSVSPAVSFPVTETTMSGRVVKSPSGALFQTSADLRFQGPNSDALMNMYGDPISSLTLYSGAISFSVRGHPSRDAPVRFQVVATAPGYQSTSESVHLTTTGTKQFQLDLLSEDPTNQPDGALGSRFRVDQIDDGTLQSPLSAETPSAPNGGAVGLHISNGATLYDDGRPTDAPIVVDLVHYSVTETTLEVLPGNGVVASSAPPRRFSVGGFLNRQIQTGSNADVSGITLPKGAQSTMWVRLPVSAIDPSSGTALQEGDPLTLFRFDTTTGTWHADTTVTVQFFSSGAPKLASGLDAAQHHKSAHSSLGIQWPLQRSLQTRWWAWGRRSQRSCIPNKTIQVNTNGQFGTVELRLQRPGLQYQRSVSLDALSDAGASLSALFEQATVPNHPDYTLTFRTRDEQTRTLSAINPCGGTRSVSLPAPTDQATRTDVLVQAIPTCPATQHVRLVSAPKVMVYYRELGTDGWNTAGSDQITWIMDDPDSPTYMTRADLRLDGLRQGTRYEFTTTYGQDQYDGSLQIPRREDATIEDGRVVVKYDRPLPDLCS